MPILLYIAIFVLAVYVQYIIAKFFADVAEEKGYHESRYFWTPFWLGIVGYLLVAALPDQHARLDISILKETKMTPSNTSSTTLPANSNKVTLKPATKIDVDIATPWLCGKCGTHNSANDDICSNCRVPKVEAAKWICINCQSENKITSVLCSNCRTNKYEGVNNPPKYICGKCGYDKDYSGNCPNCQSSMKVYTCL